MDYTIKSDSRGRFIEDIRWSSIYFSYQAEGSNLMSKQKGKKTMLKYYLDNDTICSIEKRIIRSGDTTTDFNLHGPHGDEY